MNHKQNKTMHKVIFACFVAGQKDIPKALILAESTRAFAGDFSVAPIWLMVPQGSKQLSKRVRAKVEPPLKDWLAEREGILARR